MHICVSSVPSHRAQFLIRHRHAALNFGFVANFDNSCSRMLFCAGAPRLNFGFVANFCRYAATTNDTIVNVNRHSCSRMLGDAVVMCLAFFVGSGEQKDI